MESGRRRKQKRRRGVRGENPCYDLFSAHDLRMNCIFLSDVFVMFVARVVAIVVVFVMLVARGVVFVTVVVFVVAMHLSIST